MTSSNELILKRKRAYAYIKLIFQGVAWDRDLTKNENLAEFLDISISDLNELGEGRIDPSNRIVESVKRFFAGNPDEDLMATIERELVTPFQSPGP